MRLCGEPRWQLDIQGDFVNLRFAQKVAASEVPYGLLPGLAQRATVAQSEPQVGAVISAAVQPGPFSAAEAEYPRLMPVLYWHEARQLQPPLSLIRQAMRAISRCLASHSMLMNHKIIFLMIYLHKDMISH